MSQQRQLLGFSMGSSPNHSFIGTLASIIFSVFFYQIHLKFLWGDKKSQSLIPLFILSMTNAKMKSKRVYNSEYWNALGGYTVLTVGCWTFSIAHCFSLISQLLWVQTVSRVEGEASEGLRILMVTCYWWLTMSPYSVWDTLLEGEIVSHKHPARSW